MFLQPLASSGGTFCVVKLCGLQNHATGCILRLHLLFTDYNCSIWTTVSCCCSAIVNWPAQGGKEQQCVVMKQ